MPRKGDRTGKYKNQGGEVVSVFEEDSNTQVRHSRLALEICRHDLRCNRCQRLELRLTVTDMPSLGLNSRNFKL